MKLTASIALALCLTVPLPLIAQQATQAFTDPANLAGERVTPLNGHELPIDQGALGLAELLRKLNTRASILNIVAHPDDEDGGMLTLYARGFGARVADLALTRGEGGQNFVTGDFEDALGLIRTQELLANDRYTGVTQMFGTEVDFGFSKTREESFQKWGHDRVLYDAVRAIRIYRPLVITATFIGNVTDGHGQHQVSGEIAQEAFKAAADPNVFPDMIREGILPWQALKIYARVPFASIDSKGVYDYATNEYVPARFTNYVTGAVTTTKPTADIEVPAGDPDPLLTAAAANPKDIPTSLAANPSTQLSYTQFARIGLGLQRTQISKDMRLPTSGPHNSGYTLYGSVLCNAPANARDPNITAQTCHPEQAQRAEAPAAHPTSKNAVILSEADRASASSAVEGPATRPVPTLLLTNFHPPIPTPSSRPERSAVERSLYLNSAETPHDLTTQPTFFTGIDTTIEGIADLAPDTAAAPANLRGNLRVIAAEIATAQRLFTPEHPTLITLPLADALKITNNVIQGVELSALPPIQKASVLHELRIKSVQLNDALVLAYGIKLDAGSEAQVEVFAHNGAPLKAQVSARAGEACKLHNIWLQNAAGITARESSNEEHLAVDLTQHPITEPLSIFNKTNPFHTAFTGIVTKPYFTRKDIEQPVYDLLDPSLRNAPQSPPAFTTYALVSCGQTGIEVGRIAHYMHDDQQPMQIVPNLNISLSSRAIALPLGTRSLEITAIDNSFGSFAYLKAVCIPIGCTSKPFRHGKEPNSLVFKFDIPKQLQSTPFLITTRGWSSDIQPDRDVNDPEGWRPVGYPGLILTNYYTPATTRVVPVDLKLPQHDRIAYLPGTGDAVPQSLASIGLPPTLITVADLTPAKLANFDTVILGVRTYSAHPDLQGAPTKALLDFARNGGNVVVQYQTSDFTSADAPYPLDLGPGAKVVVETDPVQLLTSTNPLLNVPNKITPADFNNWIEERGHGFLESWDPHYTVLTETHDPGGDGTLPQAPQRGGLITTQVGKGRWTYVAFALYRQLPEAVPGAYRLFVNLITPPKH